VYSDCIFRSIECSGGATLYGTEAAKDLSTKFQEAMAAEPSKWTFSNLMPLQAFGFLLNELERNTVESWTNDLMKDDALGTTAKAVSKGDAKGSATPTKVPRNKKRKTSPAARSMVLALSTNS